MKTVYFGFDPNVEPLAGLLARLLEHHGFNVQGGPLSKAPPWTAEDGREPEAALVIFALSEQDDLGSWSDGRRSVFRVAPQSAPGAYGFDCAGLEALFTALGSSFLAKSPGASEPRAARVERRTWNLARFRYGLWLEFSRGTGSGKFDPFALTPSKLERTKQALLPEIERYRYADADGSPVEPGRVLDEALQRIWAESQDQFPNAVHVIEAVAEGIWKRFSPGMIDRRRERRRGATAPTSTQQGVLFGVS
jgi:hypothetical protein